MHIEYDDIKNSELNPVLIMEKKIFCERVGLGRNILHRHPYDNLPIIFLPIKIIFRNQNCNRIYVEKHMFRQPHLDRLAKFAR